MKKIVLLVLLGLLTFESFGQNSYEDIVYLKNGSIVRGAIIEEVPNVSIKIQIKGNSIFVYQIDEIAKITKESTIKKQEKIKNGFIGLSSGPSFPIGAFGDKSDGLAETGSKISLIDFGYLFNNNLGIRAQWFGGANRLDDKGLGLDPWAYGGLMVGPFYSQSISDKVNWDFYPLIGFSATTEPIFRETGSAFAFSLGSSIRYHISKQISLTLGVEYFSATPSFIDLGYEQRIRTISTNFGLAFRLN